MNGPTDESDELDILDPIEVLDDATPTGDRPRAASSKNVVRVFVLGGLIAAIVVVALVATSSRGGDGRSDVASASLTTAHASSLRNFGTLITRFGPAVMVCGEEAMPACGTGTHLEFVTCSRALISFFYGYYADAGDARTGAFVGRPPPSGSRWSWGCGRDFRVTTTGT